MGRKDVKLCLCVYLNPCLNLPTTGDVSFHFQCNYPYAALTLAEAHEIHQGSSREDSTTFLIMRQIIEHRSPTTSSSLGPSPATTQTQQSNTPPGIAAYTLLQFAPPIRQSSVLKTKNLLPCSSLLHQELLTITTTSSEISTYTPES